MMRNNGITGWAAVNRGLRGQESPSEGRGSGGQASTESGVDGGSEKEVRTIKCGRRRSWISISHRGQEV